MPDFHGQPGVQQYPGFDTTFKDRVTESLLLDPFADRWSSLNFVREYVQPCLSLLGMIQ